MILSEIKYKQTLRLFTLKAERIVRHDACFYRTNRTTQHNQHNEVEATGCSYTGDLFGTKLARPTIEKAVRNHNAQTQASKRLPEILTNGCQRII